MFPKTAGDEGREVAGSLPAAKGISIYSAAAAAAKILSYGVFSPTQNVIEGKTLLEIVFSP